MSLVTELTLVSLRISHTLHLQTELQQAALRAQERLRRDLHGAFHVEVQKERLTVYREDGATVEYLWDPGQRNLCRTVILQSGGHPRKQAPQSFIPAGIQVVECAFHRRKSFVAAEFPGKEPRLLEIKLALSHPRPDGTTPITFRHQVILRAKL